MPCSQSFNSTPMDNTLYAALIGVAGTLICVYIGYLLSNQTSKNTIKLQEFNKAAASFRASFVKELILLDDRYITEKTPRQNASDILFNAFLRYCIAFNKFKVYISKNNIVSYEKAWNDLYHPYKDKGLDCAFLEEYFCSSTALSMQKPISEKVLAKINRLLGFAEYK